MSHEIYTVDGKDSMAFSGSVPWHGLGQRVDPDANMETWKREAGFEWTVEETPALFCRGEGSPVETFEGKKVLYRSDTGWPLSVVTDSYRPVQPETILEFFRDLVEFHGYKIVTAGSLRVGRRIWALASVNLEARLGRDDVIRPLLLLATSYDRSLATTAQFTTVQVVCDNTLGFAYEEGEKGAQKTGRFANVVRIPHVTSMDDAKIGEVKEKLGLASKAFYEFMDSIDALSQRKVTEEEAGKFFARLLHDDRLGNNFSDVPPRVSLKLAETYVNGQGQGIDTRKGTAWGLVSAVTRYVDHERNFRSPDTRLDNAWWGQGDVMKQKAVALATSLL